MNYISTRGNGGVTTAAGAIKQVLASDGGLFMPEKLPKLEKGEIAQLAKMSYPERAATILSKFLTDYTYEELLEDPSYTDVEMGYINGLKALSYTVPESNMLGISFEDEDGYMAQFLFYPISDEGFAQVASIMAASIQESK